MSQRTPIQIFDRLSRIVEEPKFPFLQSFRTDFYVQDRRVLETTWAPGTRYLWVARKSGSHLIRLGVHARLHEEIRAVMKLCDDYVAYLVEDHGVTQISAAKVDDLMRIVDFTVKGDKVLFKGSEIATLDIRIEAPFTVHQYGVASLESHKDLTLSELVALEIIADCEVLRTAKSIFTPTKEITLGGVELRSLIQQKRMSVLH